MATVAPQDLAYAEHAPVIVEQRAIVAGTPEEVWAVLLDYPGWTRWFPKVLTCQATSDPATGVGSTRVVTLPGKAEVVERFIAWDEPKVWAFTATEVPPVFAALVERVTIEPVDDVHSEVAYRMAIGPKPVLAPLFKLVRRQFASNLATALRNLDGELARRRTEAG
jgi:carbon monoxide dehydrogenase subunit G